MRLEYTFAIDQVDVPRFSVEAVEGIGKVFTLATLVMNVLDVKPMVELVFHGLNPDDPGRKIDAFRCIVDGAHSNHALELRRRGGRRGAGFFFVLPVDHRQAGRHLAGRWALRRGRLRPRAHRHSQHPSTGDAWRGCARQPRGEGPLRRGRRSERSRRRGPRTGRARRPRREATRSIARAPRCVFREPAGEGNARLRDRPASRPRPVRDESSSWP